jgi:hypothetical protein
MDTVAFLCWDPPMPTANQLNRARKLYEQREPRDLFYRVARDLLERTLAGQSDFTLTEAVAVVLLTWNRRFYILKDTPDFDARHIQDINDLLDRHGEALVSYRARSIESLREDEQATIESMFDDFDRILGPVGAAKTLHVLAPRFFALWDRSVAQGASLYLKKRVRNATLYWRWMLLTQSDCQHVGGEAVWGPGLLKRIDEFNYCRYTIGVM